MSEIFVKPKRMMPRLVAALCLAAGGVAACDKAPPANVLEASTPQEIANIFGDKQVGSITVGSLTINVLTDGNDANNSLDVRMENITDILDKLLTLPIDLGSLPNNSAGAHFNSDEIRNLTVLAKNVQLDLRDRLRRIVAGKYGRLTWDVIMSSQPDSCITSRGYETLNGPTYYTTTNCDWKSPQGVTLTSVGASTHQKIPTIIAPATSGGYACQEPFGTKPVALTAEQAATSTLVHEFLHAILSFSGTNDYSPIPNGPDGQEENIIQLLEWNGTGWVKNMSNKDQPFTWRYPASSQASPMSRDPSCKP